MRLVVMIGISPTTHEPFVFARSQLSCRSSPQLPRRLCLPRPPVIESDQSVGHPGQEYTIPLLLPDQPSCIVRKTKSCMLWCRETRLFLAAFALRVQAYFLLSRPNEALANEFQLIAYQR